MHFGEQIFFSGEMAFKTLLPYGPMLTKMKKKQKKKNCQKSKI